MSSVAAYRSWWPWLVGFDAEALRAGAVWQCVVQPPVPYRLRFSLTLHHVVPMTTVEAVVTGDVVGTALLQLADGDRPSCTEVRLSSALSPGNRALRAVALMARPVARYGHDWVLDTGARQFGDRAL